MKKIILITLFSFFGCNKFNENVEQANIVKSNSYKPLSNKEQATNFADGKLYMSNEIIALIAIKNSVPSDSTYLILQNYYIKTYDDIDSELKIYERKIESISKDFKISKDKVASIIYDFEQSSQITTE